MASSCAMKQTLPSYFSYPFGKGEASVLKTLKAGNFLGLFDVLGEESVTHADLMAVGQQFYAAQYGQPTVTSMTQARTICTPADRGSHCALCYCL